MPVCYPAAPRQEVEAHPQPSNSDARSGLAGANRIVSGSSRWLLPLAICALLFFATTINYIDRQVLGILAPDSARTSVGARRVRRHRLRCFRLPTPSACFAAGAIIDRVGTRIGFAFAISVWSLAAMGHALARSVAGFAVRALSARLGEAGNFPGGDQDRRRVVSARSARSPPASSTRARMSARSLRRCVP